MKEAFYTDKKKQWQLTKKALKYGVICLAIVIVLTLAFSAVSKSLFHLDAAWNAPVILGAPVIIAIISVYRNIILLFLPCIIVTDDRIKNFNAFWYNNNNWDKIDFVRYFEIDDRILLQRRNGRLLAAIDLDEFSSETHLQILNLAPLRKKLHVTVGSSQDYLTNLQNQIKILRAKKK